MIEENILKSEGKKIYEVGYLLLPNISEGDVSGEVSKIKDIIEKKEGVFLSEGMPELKNLAYPMIKRIDSKKQKFDNAYFGWIKFESSSVNEIKKDFDSVDNILRYLLITITKESISSSPRVNVKKGKFSFEEEKVEKETKKLETEPLDDDKGIKDKKDIKDKTENKKEDNKEEKESSKKLDETIDDLVIE